MARRSIFVSPVSGHYNSAKAGTTRPSLLGDVLLRYLLLP